jgi:putative aminopeptidase FrvX
MSGPFVSALRKLDRQLLERLTREISAERVYAYFQPIADAPAPSQTTSRTRGVIIQSLLDREPALQHGQIRFHRNFERTGNTVVLSGHEERRKRVWMLAHLDSISYFVEPGSAGRYPLTPYCYHMMQPGSQRGVALRYDSQHARYEVAAEGTIVSTADGAVFFEPDGLESIRPGDRICFHAPTEWDRDSDTLHGNLDDIGGAVALLLAALFLADYDLELMLALTDEEEGTSGAGNQTFCRGGARLLGFFDQPELVIDADVHEALAMPDGSGPGGIQAGEGACFAEKASRGRGTVTPPHLYELEWQLASELASVGIRLRENLGGYVSRSEGVNAMLRTPNVALIGFLASSRHFHRGVPEGKLSDLVDLARAAACLALLTKTPVWSDFMQEGQ